LIHHQKKGKELRNKTYVDHNVLKTLNSNESFCSNQKWPFYVENGLLKMETSDSYNEMGCYSNNDKILTVNKFSNIDVFGYPKVKTKYDPKEGCSIYSTGWPYDSYGQIPIQEFDSPHYKSKNLPVKRLPVAVELCVLDSSYFHILIEAIVKLQMLMYHPFYSI